MSKALLCGAAVLTLACASCGKGLYPVSGSVIHKGSPAAGAAVFFRRQGGDPMNEPTVMGVVRADGSFTLVCGSLGEGAPPGEYDVLIEWKQGPGHARGRGHKGSDRLGGRYADPQRPRLHATVKPQPNHLPPFELTD
jgi:hypothetical protein